ncbi:hypothetical protein ABZ682_22745 [Streptomyces griseoviridis]|uniref:hypothetical protein n=1 Tax=Streptomyces griseoviridis TaxID=45398 RepID=UPI0033E01CC5
MKIVRLTPEQIETLGRSLARAADLFRHLVDAFRAKARQLTTVLRSFTEFVQRHQLAQPATAGHRRPAWMSPYGPPTGRHR